ncbi:NUDIX domain-containing protein [Kitasatospora sp. NPDC093550]|uniref:NUDIX hydrolase n=1 Tax=Kitasatospora sp. NPDC093550 TaxID=3364089 RepID=UPI0037F444AC
MSEQPVDEGGVRSWARSLPAMLGDGWVNCAQGHAHWGRFGAAGLLPVHRAANGDLYALMHHRGADTDQGGTWALLGGARDSHESAADAAIREAVEESDLDPAQIRVERVVRDDHGGWSYDTVIATVDRLITVQPVEGESVAVAWVPLADLQNMNLHPGFVASWASVQAELQIVLAGEPLADAPGALGLPVHPVTGTRVVDMVMLDHGSDFESRALVDFEDGTRAVYESFARSEGARIKVLDAYVGRAVGARVALSHPVGPRGVYTDHMPGRPTRHQSLSELDEHGAPSTRDGVFLGLHYALTATHRINADHIMLGARQGLIAVGNGAGATSHGLVPDAANPFVRTFYRQVEPHVFAWVDNPIPPGDIAIMRRQLDGLHALFEQLGRPDLFDAVMERFDRVAEHAVGTAPLLSRPPGEHVELPQTPTRQHHSLAPEPGSPERTEHQLISDALLTDDGRITHTPQAKTIAIQALAERMRSPTAELVLAAFGLGVGTDMGHRLGDGSYVLVPHNEQYPSMGADIFHIDELDRADPRHASDKVVGMDDPRAETLVRWIAVSELMGSWSYGSNNNVRALALQEAAKEEFGLTKVLEWRMDPKTRSAVDLELDYNRNALRDFLRSQYQLTQELLASRGITELVSYRALAWQGGSERPDWFGLSVGDTFEARQRPLASWSSDRKIVSDWLEQRGGGHAVILVDRKPAKDILSIPMTGMGYLGQKEWVTLPGDGLVTLDGIFTSAAPAGAAKRTAASTNVLGGPDLQQTEPAKVSGPPEGQVLTVPDAADRWRPIAITAQLDPTDPLDSRMMRILGAEEEAPEWWPRDDSGYAIRKRDLDFLGINPVQIKWMLTGEAPMGMTPALYRQFGEEMLEALERDGIDPSEVDIRLKGTGAGFFSGIHKTLPREESLADNPTAAQHLREWFGTSQNRPLRRPYDAMWRLGLESEPSDFDLDINSTAMVRAARAHWRAHQSDRYPGDFMGGHGYLDKQTVAGSHSALAEWAARWEGKLGRPLSLGVFESSGPFDATVLGRALSSHFRDTDWIIHAPDTPTAWRTPRSRITTDVARQQASAAAGREGTTRQPPDESRPAGAIPSMRAAETTLRMSVEADRRAGLPPEQRHTEGEPQGRLQEQRAAPETDPLHPYGQVPDADLTATLAYTIEQADAARSQAAQAEAQVAEIAASLAPGGEVEQRVTARAKQVDTILQARRDAAQVGDLAADVERVRRQAEAVERQLAERSMLGLPVVRGADRETLEQQLDDLRVAARQGEQQLVSAREQSGSSARAASPSSEDDAVLAAWHQAGGSVTEVLARATAARERNLAAARTEAQTAHQRAVGLATAAGQIQQELGRRDAQPPAQRAAEDAQRVQSVQQQVQQAQQNGPGVGRGQGRGGASR